MGNQKIIMGILYLITNKVNGKQYVGKTYDSVENRWRDHKKKSKTDIKRPLYRAINKYGSDSFTIEIVSQYDEGILETEEENLIKKLGTFGNGYNATSGGDGRKHSKYSDDELIELYNKLGSTKEVARQYKVCATRLQKILKTHNIELNKGVYRDVAIKIHQKHIIYIEENKSFNNLTECAEYLVAKGIATSNLKVVKEGISRVVRGERKTYLKQNFKEGTAKVANQV